MKEATVQALLRAVSTAFETRDVEGLLRLFSAATTVCYAGSEKGEKATGPAELRRLLSTLLSRPVAYSFELGEVTFGEYNGLVWVLADGEGTETGEEAGTQTFPYRLTGLLANENAQWRWLALVGSELTSG
jgi:hypothetical protein